VGLAPPFHYLTKSDTMPEVLTRNWFQMWKYLLSWLQMKFKLKVFCMEMLVLCQVTINPSVLVFPTICISQVGLLFVEL
jgi:hypothetical protein